MTFVAITIDLHQGDDPGDIGLACEVLQERGIQATFFVPSAMLEDARYRTACRAILRTGHEPASHSHDHDFVEMRALMSGSANELGFLARSKAIHEDYFGREATAFRSPCWCHLGPPAVEMLAELGYRVDSSATPQRLGILSSTPFDNVWTLAPRRPWELAPGLLEVPTSCFLVPAGAPTFMVLRRRGSRLLLRLLAWEAGAFSRPLTVQFHVGFLNPSSVRHRRPSEPLSVRDFIPRRSGGLGFKHRLRSSDMGAMAEIAAGILDAVDPSRCLALSTIAAHVTASRRTAVRSPS